MPYLRVLPSAINEGAATVTLTIVMDQASSNPVQVNYDTVNGQAFYNSAAPDFQRNFGTLTFAPGETSKTLTVNIVNNTTAEGSELFWLDLNTPVNATVQQRYWPVLIVDNDGTSGTPQIAVSDRVVDEASGTAQFFVTLNRPSTGTVSVQYTTADDTATAGSDYTAASGSLSFAAGETVKTVTVNLLNDPAAEVDEYFRLQLSNATNATIVDGSGLGLIGRNDADLVSQPFVTARPIAADESAAFTQFVVQLSAPSSNEVKVNFDTVNGLAFYNSSAPDFQRHFGTLVFAPGETTKLVVVPIVDNTTAETPEQFWLDLNTPVNAIVPQRYTPALLIDNDATAGTPALAVSDAMVDETDGTAQFFVTLNKPSTGVVTVNYTTAGDTAAAGSDFRAATGTLSFAPGETVKTVIVDITNDGDAEADEAFRLDLATPTGATIVDGSGRGLIVRNDAAPVSQPAISAMPIAGDESQALLRFAITLSAPSSNQVEVNFDLANATAYYNSSVPDYQRHFGTLVFAPGETSRIVAFALVDNTQAEGTEALWLDLNSPVNATVPQRYTPVLLFDNDAVAGTPLVSVSDAVVDETSGSASFFVSLNRPSTGTVTVGYATGDATAMAGSDYRAAAGTLTFAAGEVVKAVTVDLFDDADTEADEVFRLNLSSPAGATIVDAFGSATIGRNDGPPVGAPHISARPIVADESQALTGFTIELSAPSGNEVKVNFDLANATAYYNSSAPDYQRHFGTLVFAPGETTRFVPLTILDDTQAESRELWWLDLNTPVNATVPQRYTPGIIVDNDGIAGTPAIAVGDVTVDESAGTASFFVWMNRPSTGTVTVNYATADQTAQAGSDFRAASGSLSFAPGEVAKTVTIDLYDDAATEVDEFFNLTLSAPSGATLADGSGVAQIGRSDAAPAGMPYVIAHPAFGDESQPALSFVIQLSSPSSNPVEVDVDLANALAFYNSSAPDYQRHFGTLVFAPGETTRTITVPLIDNTLVEGVESFWLDLNSPVNATVPQRWTPARLYDNDAVAGTPAIRIGDAVVDERAGIATLPVWLDKPSVGTVTVNWTTADDTAAAATDYRAASGTLSFAPGETVKTLTIDITDDGLAEFDEALRLQLSGAAGGTLADAVGAVLIGRSDTAPVSQPRIGAGPISVGEGDVLAGFLVQLSAPSGNEVKVNFDMANGTAFHNSSAPDFQRLFGTLVFAPGETTKLVSSPLIDDTTAEATETWTLSLSAPVNATIPQAQATGTLIDNDGPATYSFGLGNDRYSVSSAQDRIAESPRGGIDTVVSSASFTLPENVENLVLTGSATTGTGNASNNVFRGTAGNNSFDGGAGIDTAVFGGARADYTITGSVAQRTVAGGGDGSDTLFNVERLQFSDQVLASDTSPGQNTYLAYAMLNAAFNVAPGSAQLSQWTAMLDRQGGNLEDLAQAMINFYAPGVPNDVLVAYLWSTIIESPIPSDALALYTGLVNDGTFTQASLLALVTTIDFNTVEIAGIVGQTLTLDPAWFPVPG
ncbi:Calx-beta domain-containing protein [Aquabacterium humicola]|uniref:Calx-beta domain-containing protein n=1 Tax=Aquabacterium humicola TaxID=3237377 RepID=UPI002542889E|nr:Calx-beta domain-containing protein [Rubrivivax pictus]